MNYSQLVARLGAKIGATIKPELVVPADLGMPRSGPDTSRQRPSRDAFTSIGIFGQQGYETERTNRTIGYKDNAILFDNVPEYSRALDIIASHTVAGDHTNDRGITLEFKSEDYRQTIDALFQRLDLHGLARPFVRSANQFGDLYRFLVFDKNGIMIRSERLDHEKTVIETDERGVVTGYRCTEFVKGQDQLQPWEVVHWAHGADHSSLPYGRSLLAGGGRTVGHRVLTLRDALTYEVLIHSTARNAIFLPRPSDMSQDARDQWLDNIQDAFKREKIVDSNGLLTRKAISLLNVQDVFIDFPFDAETGRPLGEPKVQPLHNAPVIANAEIDARFQKILFIVTGVPGEYFGVQTKGEGLSSNRLELVDLAFAMQINAEQMQLGRVLLEFAERQLLALGKVLEPGEVSVVSPDLRWLDKKIRAETMWLHSQAAEKLTAMGLPPAFIWTEVIHDGDRIQAEENAERYGFKPADTPGIQVVDEETLNAGLAAVRARSSVLRDALRLRQGSRVTTTGMVRWGA